MQLLYLGKRPVLDQPAALGGGVPQDRLRLVPTLGRQPGDTLQHALRGHAVLNRQDGVGLFLAPVHLQKKPGKKLINFIIRSSKCSSEGF
jgi:hypothetical protein